MSLNNIKAIALLSIMMLVTSGTASASGFALIEQNGSGLGNSFAGGAAGAEDASTIFYNPAGLSRLPGKQIVVSGVLIKPSMNFSGTVTGLALQTAGTNTGGDAGSLALVPDAYFSMEYDPQLHFGLGINAPFGLQTEYDSAWMGRFQAVKSKLQAANLNPSLSYKVNEVFSFGAGISYQHITGTLTSMVNYSALAGGALGANLEGLSTINGSDSAWGYNAGVLFNLDPQTRLGAAYRSKIKYVLNGTVTFDNVPAPMAASVPNSNVTLPITMPDTLSLSGFRKLDDKFDIMADATWTGWGVFQQLVVTRTNGTVLSTTQENWKNTWRVSAGANYHYSPNWMGRFGIALDQSPVSDTYRTARIPDSNRKWLSIGGQYKTTSTSTIDFGYAHLFMDNANISQNKGAGYGNLVGTYSNSVDILSAQYTYNF